MCRWTGSSLARPAVLAVLLLLMAAFPAGAGQWDALEARLEADGLDPKLIRTAFAAEGVEYDPKIMARKMGSLLRIRLAGREEPEGDRDEAEEPQVFERYLQPLPLAAAYVFLRDNQEEFAEIEKKFGVPGTVLTAMLLVETSLGRTLGTQSALATLASMAVADNAEAIAPYVSPDPGTLDKKDRDWLDSRTRQKSDWAYQELKALMLYAQAAGVNPADIPGSPYGAIGLCQFIPTSARDYGRDGDGDGKVDLFTEPDALHSMANFLKRHGWKRGLTRPRMLAVIYHYNHSHVYTRTIMAVADKLGEMDKGIGGKAAKDGAKSKP